jgi:hypothetical protein
MLLRVQRIGELGADALLQIVVIRLIELRRLDLALGLARLLPQLVNSGADFLDLGVAELDRVHHCFFFYFLGARLNHHDAFRRSHHHDVEQALAHLVVGGIHHELPIDQPDAHRADRPEKRNIGNVQRRRGPVDAHHVGIILAVG